jgi:hypothetical protein
LQCIPKHVIEKNIGKRDLHGCTPLHVAYLHKNTAAAQFLIANGAETDISDYFHVKPHEISQTEDHLDSSHRDLCYDLLNSKSDLLGKLRSMLVISPQEAKKLHDELRMFFERVVRKTKFKHAKVVIAGSLRERLKVGRLDEADIQLCFESDQVPRDKMVFATDLRESLIANISKISFNDIFLRPVSVAGPWNFIREGSGPCKGMLIDVDVVCVIVENEEEKYIQTIQAEVIDGAPVQKKMTYLALQMGKEGEERRFRETLCETEGNIWDSMATRNRLGVTIAKSLVQASIHILITVE